MSCLGTVRARHRNGRSSVPYLTHWRAPGSWSAPTPTPNGWSAYRLYYLDERTDLPDLADRLPGNGAQP